METAAPINLVDLLRHQRSERYRAVLVIGNAATGKSAYARKLARKLGAGYVDMLAQFQENTDLSGSIDSFDREALLDVLQAKAEDQEILIVDNCDFLLNTWTDVERSEFAAWLGKLDNIRCPVVLCFFVQPDDVFEDLLYTPTTDGQSRMAQFSSLMAL